MQKLHNWPTAHRQRTEHRSSTPELTCGRKGRSLRAIYLRLIPCCARKQSVVILLPQDESEPMFGEFIKQIRERQRLGLREFCLQNGYDPSNWSKIEREVLPPPRDEDTLRAWARQLGLKQASEDWLKFFDYAAVDSGRIPDYVLKDEKLVAQLPVFFRTISGQKPSREDLEKLVELIRSANRP